MKILKYIIFISILSSIFFIIYRQSDKEGFHKLWAALKLAAIIAGILAGLIPTSANAKDSAILQGTDAFTPSISRPSPNNQGYFGIKTISNSGSPKKDPSGSSANSNGNAKPKIAHQTKSQNGISTSQTKQNKKKKLKK